MKMEIYHILFYSILCDDNTNLVAYADYAYVVCADDSIQCLSQRLCTTMTTHINWLRDCGMVVNPAKTELMMMGDHEIEIKVHESILKSQGSIKVLGLLFDRHLKWNVHAEKVIAS